MKSLRWRSYKKKRFNNVSHIYEAWEQALLFGRASLERASEGPRKGDFSANGISLRVNEVQMKFYERSLQALLSSAPRGFAARSRVLASLASLAQIGELARRLIFTRPAFSA